MGTNICNCGKHDFAHIREKDCYFEENSESQIIILDIDKSLEAKFNGKISKIASIRIIKNTVIFFDSNHDKISCTFLGNNEGLEITI